MLYLGKVQYRSRKEHSWSSPFLERVCTVPLMQLCQRPALQLPRMFRRKRREGTVGSISSQHIHTLRGDRHRDYPFGQYPWWRAPKYRSRRNLTCLHSGGRSCNPNAGQIWIVFLVHALCLILSLFPTHTTSALVVSYHECAPKQPRKQS